MSRDQPNSLMDQKGFTLLEFLISVLILTVGLLGMGSLTVTLIGHNAESYNRTKAAAMAQNKIEEIKNMNYQLIRSLPNGSDTDAIFTREWEIDPDEPDTGMVTIAVEVSWNWKGADKDILVKTIVAK